LREMNWEERLWLALKDAMSGMPTFIRGKAMSKIVSSAEGYARKRGSNLVEREDLARAFDTAVPKAIKPLCRRALKDAGVEV